MAFDAERGCRGTGFPFQVEVAIAPSHGGSPYRVLKHLHADAVGEAATAEEAVALAVHLPPPDSARR
ncbi:DUF6193 family natural product biosynthesis protein [Streptomyces sp. A0592]|uniref:DUF6193 family natural product biosynthesis protein n=1 Tax=Streptomyces sp. A0592 TaxID=2563099 RepID=UPI0023F01B6A|nr:DUF6193 family natural product biosynthesis protein [Streptomyces sp. A0592]